ncbi:MAG: matrixin family metalloprotease [Vampirovibrionales bacterium]
MPHVIEPTYLDACLHQGKLIRWPDHMMPLKVYVAPFQWYERAKQQHAWQYHQMVLNAFQSWSQATEGKIRFQTVPKLADSHVNLVWRRVDRNSLGHCQYDIHPSGFLYSCELSIGISDGLVHQKYNHQEEVKHTILHEVGHALGLLGHSDHPEDIMYVPHRFGVHQLSARDKATMHQLYQLPSGLHVREASELLGLKPPYRLQTFIEKRYDTQRTALQATRVSNFKEAMTLDEKASVPEEDLAKKLEEEQALLSQLGQMYLHTSGLKPSMPVVPVKRYPFHIE